MKDDKLPRKPNEKETDELAFYVAEEILGGFESNDNLEEARNLVENAYIAVFDNYITDSPGYVGKVMSVIWSGSPNIYEVFTWDKKRNIRREKPELVK